MLWIKAFHIIFVVTWFAGLFYLPRLFVYHTEATDPISLERFGVMERRLFGIMTIGGVLAALFGILLLWQLGGLSAANWQMGWWQAKLLMIALLIGYHYWCYRLIGNFAAGIKPRSSKWYRWFNEAPTFLLIGIVVLVVVRPF